MQGMSLSSALDAVHHYYTVFSTLDVNAIVACYSESSMTLTPQGVLSAPDRATLAKSLVPLIAGLTARGYGRSEFVQPEVTVLSGRTELVRGVAVRYTSAGTELERIPLGYLMDRAESGWKIAVLIVGP
jgi:hypothetical protein